MAATAKPDGYTLSQAVVVLLRLPHMQKVAFEPLRDFTYISNVTAYTFGIVVKADGPIKTWADLEKYARENPGKVTYATPGVGTSLHIGMEEIAARSGLKFTHVPMKGAGESSAAVLGDHVLLQVDATNWKPLVDAGKLRPLVVWSSQRLPSLPDVPTLAEVLPAFRGDIPAMFESPFGIVGPKGMDPAIVAKLDAAFKKATEDPGVQAMLSRYDMYPKYMDAAAYRKFAEATWEVERKVLERLGMLRKD
jgi:tripartite-type tricarboxylate transporter receptor subunit TctC